jgi:hypothetical protein
MNHKKKVQLNINIILEGNSGINRKKGEKIG